MESLCVASGGIALERTTECGDLAQAGPSPLIHPWSSMKEHLAFYGRVRRKDRAALSRAQRLSGSQFQNKVARNDFKACYAAQAPSFESQNRICIIRRSWRGDFAWKCT
jgi:hypothetical protein